ncbi:MAG TPA: thioredoxin [Thermomicrobiaceae bacterium]|nr:thioredoxin [Thermomicrobiaceae bacterium]
MAKPEAVTDATFNQTVVQSDKPVLVDFWAEWCGPCRMVAPILDEIAREKDGELKIAKVNVDQDGRIAQSLGIVSIPTLILYKNGKPVERIVGAQPKQRLLAQIEKHLS